MKNRRGFTLIELLISLFMMVVVAGGLYSLMVTVYRVTRKQTEVSNLQANLRQGMQLVQSELQELYTDAPAGLSDINALSLTAIRYDGMRGVGETCGISAGGGAIQIRQATYSGPVPKQNRDRLLLFQDRDTSTAADDTWLEETITGVTAGTCSVGDADASWNISVPGLTGNEVVDAVSGDPLVFAPGPVRTTEEMEMGLVSDGGQDWLGLRSVSDGETALVPVVGPLVGGGVDFKYYNGANTITGDASAVKQIKITLWGISAQAVNAGMGSELGSQRDSVVIRVQLRNSR